MEKKTVRRVVYDSLLLYDNHGMRTYDDCNGITLTRNKAIRRLYDALQELDEYQRAHIYEANILRWVIDVDPSKDLEGEFLNAGNEYYQDPKYTGRAPRLSYVAPVPTIPDTEWQKAFGENAC